MMVVCSKPIAQRSTPCVENSPQGKCGSCKVPMSLFFGIVLDEKLASGHLGQ